MWTKIGATKNPFPLPHVVPLQDRMGSALDPQLQSLKVTHVYYNPSDPLSLASAFLALIPQALMVIYVTLIYARREIEVVLMVAGQLLCELANWILKRVIKEDRPPGIGHSPFHLVVFICVVFMRVVCLRGRS